MKLSICIATYNRASFLPATLDSILCQMEPGVELIVVDGASPDNTREVMGRYLREYPDIRYYCEAENSGVDRDYDKAVGYATGQYCWLMTDDDLLNPGAIGRVLSALDDGPDLLIVNAEVRDAACSRVLDGSMIKGAKGDSRFGAGDSGRLLAEMAQCLSFIGCVIVDRAIWLSRDRPSYYGTLFIHVGVIFQGPPLETVKVIYDPLIVIRYGNAMWTSRGFEIWMFKWPQLIWSFEGIPESSKAMACARFPWRDIKRLVLSRGMGGYSFDEYRRFLAARLTRMERVLPFLIAVTPAEVVNSVSSLYILMFAKDGRMGMYDLVRSRYATWITRLAAGHMGV